MEAEDYEFFMPKIDQQIERYGKVKMLMELVDLQTALKITEYANKNKFDLILMNSHNKGKIEKYFLASVTEEVVRNSKIPVVSIKTFSM